MARFDECFSAEQRDEFIYCIEELLIDPTKIKALLPQDKFNQIMELLPTLKAPDCTCGTCILMSKLDAPELQCLMDIARSRCVEKN